MFCKNCGAQLPDETKICSNCGAPIAAENPTLAPAPAPQPATPEAAPETPAAPVATLTPPAEKKRGNFLVGILVGFGSALVVALIILALFLLPRESGNDQLESQPSTTASEPSQPTSPAVKTELIVNDAQLTYELTDADVEAFYTLLTQLKEAALGGQDGDAVMALSDAIDDQYYYMSAQNSIAAVLYYCDLNDEAASQLYLDCTELLTQAYNDYIEVAKELYEAQFPAKERFFEEWSELDLAQLLSYTPEVMELEMRNSEIEVAYQALQDDPDMYTKMVPLYIEMVQNNNRIAQIYGYENFYEYAYVLSYDRDYSTDEIKLMRQYVAQYLPDAAVGAYSSFYSAYINLEWSEQYALENFMYGAYDAGYADEIAAYLDTLPEQTRKDMLNMFDGNIIMADSNPSAQEGAFTTAIGEDRNICFFGPGYNSALTIIHEVGHYYGATYNFLNDIPLDLAETQSQGNEWLFMSFMESQMDTNFYNATIGYKTYNDIVTILLSVIIDEFEEQVYTHPNIASLTSDDLDAIMKNVCSRYGGIEFLGEIATDVQSYWRYVVIEQPVYYISYGVSAIAALNIYTVADEDYQQAVEIYCNLNENVDLDLGFLGNLEQAGLDGPFDEDVYKKLYQIAS